MNVTATELKQRLGRYIDAAAHEPIIIEKSGRNAAVILSYAEYERLEAMEDAYWGQRALKALEDNEWVENGLAAIEEIAKNKK